MSEGIRGGGRSPTLEAVAARAGVSRATVSRVVNNAPQVAAEIVTAVQKAIAELDYVPNRAARMLASRRTQSIALIVPESTARVFADPFFAAIVQGAAMRLADTDYTLSMLIASETSGEKTRRYLLGGNVDGALVVSHHSGDHSYAALSNSLPIVFGGRPLSPDERDSYYVDVDNADGAAVATAHLIAGGRRRIATIAGPADMPPGVDRLIGWRSALTDAGLDDSLVEWGDFSPESGTDAMRRLLERDPSIDGLFAANDQMAVGAYAALREAGRRVPEDVAVVGFDDDIFARSAVPALSTVRQVPVDLGARMAELLTARIEGVDVDHRTLMPTELVVRASS
ncbi:LacI family DNA-binding transcriptional regulator [Rathayibacter sp. VKM Ac-2856]|uniref:LacI family DNA-binding transcriptional regulator n=1 Tax=unclassified Rathayibacter TaxID=2609250 RepID=UPI001563C102|nr:LacI family DNA-binding transcriptional regulator [Rathayibacter sp. VKM Ac-2858]NQX19686.1 LacI family DNA-binding transcriptional regulator [Rathayibacter sp. VKM Ac-2856]